MTPARLNEIRRRLADQYPDGWIGVCVELLSIAVVQDVDDENERLRADVARLREALRPLAAGLDGWQYAVDWDSDIGRMNYTTGIRVRDVFAAREALAATEPKP
jgi:hypothetical protein